VFDSLAFIDIIRDNQKTFFGFIYWNDWMLQRVRKRNSKRRSSCKFGSSDSLTNHFIIDMLAVQLTDLFF
jgi:hypothetical protein